MSTKKKTKVEPAKFAQPALNSALGGAQTAYTAAQPVQQQVTDALGGAFSGFQSRMGRSNPYAGIGANDPGIGLLSGFAGNRETNPAAGRVSALGDGGFVGQGAAADYWRKSLSGDFLNGNPYLDGVIDASIEDANDAANSQFSMAGRYGSGAHAGVLAKNAGRISSQLRAQNYDTERGYQNQAAGLLDQATRSDRGQQLQALGLLGDLSNADTNRQLQAAGLLSDAYRSGEALKLNAQQAADGSELNNIEGLLRLAAAYQGSPYGAVQPFAQTVGALTAPYSQTTQKTGGLGSIAGLGLLGYDTIFNKGQ